MTILQRLSQSHLRLLDRSPAQFHQRYIAGLDLPPLPQDRVASERGRRFHELMQQRQLGLPIDDIVASDPDLQRYMRAYDQAPPPALPAIARQETEYPLACHHSGFQLYGILDRLVVSDTALQIVDWKTYLHPPTAAVLSQQWQTRLYLYLAQQTFQLPAAALSMIYWFPEQPNRPAIIRYSQAEHAATEARLTTLLSQLNHWLATDSFPTLPPPLPSPTDLQVALDVQAIAPLPPP